MRSIDADDDRWLVDLWKGEQTIENHGFRWEQLNFNWFSREIQDSGGQLSRHLRDTQQSLQRGDLFKLARGAFPDEEEEAVISADSEEDILNFVWHVLIWGSGKSMRQNKVRIASILESGPQRIRSAVNLVKREGVAPAYRSMQRGGNNYLRGLGSAFFTKVLYFAGGGAREWKPLILDSRVKNALVTHGSGAEWTRHLDSPRGYEDYCEHLAHTASTIGIRADQLEKVLFDRGSRPKTSSSGEN